MDITAQNLPTELLLSKTKTSKKANTEECLVASAKGKEAVGAGGGGEGDQEDN